MNKKIITGIFCVLPIISANAGLFDGVKNILGSENTEMIELAGAAATMAGVPSAEEAVKKLIDKCMTPTPDGICECVANATFGDMNSGQWAIVNRYMFGTRAKINTTDFLLQNPWLVTKLTTTYFKCNGKK